MLLMKILFIENRGRTNFWSKIGELLQNDGHTIHFIIENHSFTPKIQGFVNYIIPYCKYNKESLSVNNDIFSKIKRSDRAINHFGIANNSHYQYYHDKINEYINEVKPDVVFGESTAFHELLAIEICKKLNILYLQPSTCRYPTGRFSFYKYDTLEPFGGCNNLMTESDAISAVESITNRKIIPDYMKKRNKNISVRFNRLRDLLNLTMDYYAGEKYNTPSSFHKIKIEGVKKRNITQWEELVSGRTENNNANFKILYPLQMQPEANLDVWGRKYNNQVELIKAVLDNTDKDVAVIVKPNPKSKYEMSQELLQLVESEPRIIPISHQTAMKEVFSTADMVLTVTGTIAIECILSNKPVVTLVNTLNNEAANCIWLESIKENLQHTIVIIIKDEFPKIAMIDKVNYINHLYTTSYIGKPYDNYLDVDNVMKCKEAFEDILIKI